MGKKYVYLFSEGSGQMRELLGGKGANLAETMNLGMPVPFGFTVTTKVCNQHYADGGAINEAIRKEILDHLTKSEELSKKQFGDPKNPLLVSVRFGTRVSMPGMMDTILNLGPSDEVVEGITGPMDNPRFVHDSYHRFTQMFADVVMGLNRAKFEDIIDEMREKKGVEQDIDLDASDMKEVVKRFKKFHKDSLEEDFPSNPKGQLCRSIEAVSRFWNNQRVIFYRKMNDIPRDRGTAVNVQMMVFDNMGNDCDTGVVFTCNPSTGESKLYGEFLMNVQGGGAVAGIRTPRTIDQLKEITPAAYQKFTRICVVPESHHKNMQDMEFTTEKGNPSMLQIRNGKRAAASALKIACDIMDKGMITKEEAMMMMEPGQLGSLLHPRFDDADLKSVKPIASALPASPGTACGQIVFFAEETTEETAFGHKAILVRLETSPEGTEGIHVSEDIPTVCDGMTPHAAVVAHGMGACCVSGCGDIKINEEEKYFVVNEERYNKGDYTSLDGSTGNIYGYKIKTVPAKISGDFERFTKWTDEIRTLKARTNADAPKDAARTVAFGAEGIGLVRAEHTLFEGDRIKAVREMIVSKTEGQRRKAPSKLLSMQRGDFEGTYEAMHGLSVTIRYLDPPLHEFLPTSSYDIVQLAKDISIDPDELKSVISGLHEFNPMMGHRGCRLAIFYPETAEMQTTAVIEAAINASRKHLEWKIEPEIVIPLAGDKVELKFVKDVVVCTADGILRREALDMKYHVGMMIEIPRAVLLTGEIAEEAEFSSSGTNDLIQMTSGFSRDDAGGFLDNYYEKKIFEQDPSARVDQKGVGKLIETAVAGGRKTRPEIKLGICGERGGDPSSIDFCHRMGLNCVSCSPFRVPIARPIAAQVAINHKKG